MALSRTQPFDRELTLAELLAGVPLERLGASLAALLEAGFRLADSRGHTLLSQGEVASDAAAVELQLEIEPVGRLVSAATAARLKAAAALLELLLRCQQRYRMAAELHEEQVDFDYQALQQKHAALQQSEQQYRELSEQLEQRVQQQVETIKTAERQLYQAEKLASVGKLAAGVAHEINNPLGFVHSNLASAAGYVRKFAELGAAVKSGDAAAIQAAWKGADMDFVLEDFGELLQESMAGAERVARIVADLKEFSNVDRAQEEIVFLNESIRAACNIVQGQIEGRAELVLELGELPPLTCQQGHLNQLLLNLLVNALQAVKDQAALGKPGVIRVETALVGQEIRLRVIDNGCGIAPENLGKIFDPFFTTRQVGQGTGLGLSVCRDIAQAHGGRIEVESRPGAGSTFTVTLPVR